MNIEENGQFALDIEGVEFRIAKGTTSFFKKSNLLIQGKYRASLLENQVYSMAIAKLQKGVMEKGTGTPVCVINAYEFKELLGKNDGSFYEVLKNLPERLTEKRIGIYDPVNKMFGYIVIITGAIYKDGVLYIRFNPDLAPLLYVEKSSYSQLELPLLLKFKNAYSFRLYELLKSRAYMSRKEKGDFQRSGCTLDEVLYEIHMNISELKLELGVVNPEDKYVKKILNNSSAPDYDRAVEGAQDYVYGRWSSFKSRVLDVAVNEINKESDMHVEYQLLKVHKSHKVVEIVFFVRYRDLSLSSGEETVPGEQIAFIRRVSDFVEERFSYEDLRSLSKIANWEFDRIERAYALMKTYKTPIRNKIGFLITAVRDNWETISSEDVRNLETAQYPSAWGGLQTEYDFDALERALRGLPAKHLEISSDSSDISYSAALSDVGYGASDTGKIAGETGMLSDLDVLQAEYYAEGSSEFYSHTAIPNITFTGTTEDVSSADSNSVPGQIGFDSFLNSGFFGVNSSDDDNS